MVVELFGVDDSLPREEMYGLRAQMCRAAVSIPSNIAEGCSRRSEFDFKRFLEIAVGSAFELETQLHLTRRLRLLSQENVDKILTLLLTEQKMINSLISRIAKGQ